MNHHQPTEPGPFQKYLFSAACYVQVGRCYAALLENWPEAVREGGDRDLQRQLAAAWQEAFERQAVMAGGLLDNLRPQGLPAINEDLDSFREQVREAGDVAMQSLLRQLSQDPLDAPDFITFFRAWAIACDRAYGELVRSDAFAGILGGMINGFVAMVAAGPKT